MIIFFASGGVQEIIVYELFPKKERITSVWLLGGVEIEFDVYNRVVFRRKIRYVWEFEGSA